MSGRVMRYIIVTRSSKDDDFVFAKRGTRAWQIDEEESFARHVPEPLELTKLYHRARHCERKCVHMYIREYITHFYVVGTPVVDVMYARSGDIIE